MMVDAENANEALTAELMKLRHAFWQYLITGTSAARRRLIWDDWMMGIEEPRYYSPIRSNLAYPVITHTHYM